MTRLVLLIVVFFHNFGLNQLKLQEKSPFPLRSLFGDLVLVERAAMVLVIGIYGFIEKRILLPFELRVSPKWVVNSQLVPQFSKVVSDGPDVGLHDYVSVFSSLILLF